MSCCRYLWYRFRSFRYKGWGEKVLFCQSHLIVTDLSVDISCQRQRCSLCKLTYSNLYGYINVNIGYYLFFFCEWILALDHDHLQDFDRLGCSSPWETENNENPTALNLLKKIINLGGDSDVWNHITLSNIVSNIPSHC